MLKALLTWKSAVAVVITFSVLGVLNATVLQDRFCPVIDDFRSLDTAKVSSTFDQAKIAYYVDFKHSHQILVEQSQVQDAYRALANIGITAISNSSTTCRVVQ